MGGVTDQHQYSMSNFQSQLYLDMAFNQNESGSGLCNPTPTPSVVFCYGQKGLAIITGPLCGQYSIDAHRSICIDKHKQA